MSKNFQVYYIHINFFKRPNKKIYNKAKDLYCDPTIFLISLLSTCPKKMETEKWPKAANSPLPLTSAREPECAMKTNTDETTTND